jgi:L-2,4-diaminobutyrate decarboxylase
MNIDDADSGFLADVEWLSARLDSYRRESESKTRPVTRLPTLESLIELLDLDRYPRDGGLTGADFQSFVTRYLDATTRLHHPAYFCHQVAVPHSSGALAALIDGYTNNPMAIYEMGPPAAAIEYFVINWMLRKVGWTPAPLTPNSDTVEFGGGTLTHGGSLANLTALIAARTRAAPRVWEEGVPPDLAILAPEQSHYSIARAAGILGLGARGVYSLPVDSRGVVLPDRLPEVLRQLRDAGRRPMALVANACSTATGLYDPLQEIGAFCREQGIWFHVDGAHGASALLSPSLRKRMLGIEMADSMIWDAHKMLRTPPLCAAVLVRDYRSIDGAFHQEASYLFHDKEQPGVDFLHRTVECTKAALGLKFYMVLGAMGEAGLREYVEGRTQAALEAYRYLKAQPDFQCPVEPQSNILCFAFRDWNTEHLKVRDQLIADGRFHLSTTQLGGRWFLRAVFMNPRSGLTEIEELAGALRVMRGPEPPGG